MSSAPTRPGSSTEALAWVEGRTFLMGSADFYPEEAPRVRRSVDGFWLQRHPVTVAQFAEFVADTGHVTLAERPPDPALYPGADPADLVPGSLVFRPTAGPVPLHDLSAWWHWVPGASWHAPEGPGSTVDGREQHPVVHVGHEDAQAYAAWAGLRLPTEAEWELAAWGGAEPTTYAWGEEPMPGGQAMANTWQGRFPWENLALDGHVGTSPVGSFPANGHGLVDLIGNVWEWTDQPWTDDHRGAAVSGAAVSAAAAAAVTAAEPAPSCCSPAAAPVGSLGPDGLPVIPRRVIKGGSHLCAPSYCLRYRPAARQGEPVDSTTSHLGFRCALRPDRGAA